MKIAKLSILSIIPLFVIILFFFIVNTNGYFSVAFVDNEWFAFIIYPPLLLGSLAFAYAVSKDWKLVINNWLLIIVLYLILFFYQEFHLFFRYDVRTIAISILIVYWFLSFSINILLIKPFNKK